MSSTHPAVWVFGASGALIPLVLLGGSSLLAWRRLAHTYPDQHFAVETTFRAISGQVGGTYGTVKGGFRIDIGNAGLRISTWPLLRRLLPPFMIPWSEITACSRERYYFSPCGVRLDLAQWAQPIHLWNRGWRDGGILDLIQTRWEERATLGA